MQRVEVRLDWGDEERTVGTLAEKDRRVFFEFDAQFISSPLPVSPFRLPVRAGLFEHTDRDFSRTFGLFNDSLPDGWGLLLMDRDLRKRGVDLRTVTVLDRLTYIGKRGMGALTYHPTTEPAETEPLGVELEAVAHQAERILKGSAEEVLPALRLAGGSPGGARPKVLVGVRDDLHILTGIGDLPEGYRHYIIKFPAQEDLPDIGAVESAYSLMAFEAGLDIPPVRLFETPDGGRYFGAERFDRAWNRRLHMHSLSGLLHADHRIASVEYEGFLRATLALTRDHRQVEEAFRRMVFNVAAHNRDDHVKNFSYLMDRSGVWKLAPAYDVVFSRGPGGEHTMAVAGEALNPGDRDMLAVAEACGLDHRRARGVIERVRDTVQDWPRFARVAGVSPASQSLISQAIRLPPTRQQRRP